MDNLQEWALARQMLDEAYLIDLEQRVKWQLEDAPPKSDTSELLEDVLALIAQVRESREKAKGGMMTDDELIAQIEATLKAATPGDDE